MMINVSLYYRYARWEVTKYSFFINKNWKTVAQFKEVLARKIEIDQKKEVEQYVCKKLEGYNAYLLSQRGAPDPNILMQLSHGIYLYREAAMIYAVVIHVKGNDAARDTVNLTRLDQGQLLHSINWLDRPKKNIYNLAPDLVHLIALNCRYYSQLQFKANELILFFSGKKIANNQSMSALLRDLSYNKFYDEKNFQTINSDTNAVSTLYNGQQCQLHVIPPDDYCFPIEISERFEVRSFLTLEWLTFSDSYFVYLVNARDSADQYYWVDSTAYLLQLLEGQVCPFTRSLVLPKIVKLSDIKNCADIDNYTMRNLPRDQSGKFSTLPMQLKENLAYYYERFSKKILVERAKWWLDNLFIPLRYNTVQSSIFLESLRDYKKINYLINIFELLEGPDLDCLVEYLIQEIEPFRQARLLCLYWRLNDWHSDPNPNNFLTQYTYPDNPFIFLRLIQLLLNAPTIFNKLVNVILFSSQRMRADILAVLAIYVPDALETLIELLETKHDWPEKFAEVMTVQSIKHKRILEIFVTHTEDNMLGKILGLLEKAPNGAEKLTEAIAYQNREGRTLLEMIAWNSSGNLKRVLVHLATAPHGACKLAEVIAYRNNEDYPILTCIACDAPEALEAIFDLVLTAPHGAQKLVKALIYKDPEGLTTFEEILYYYKPRSLTLKTLLSLTVCHAPASLKEVLALLREDDDNDVLLAETKTLLFKMLVIPDNYADGQTTLAKIASDKNPEALKTVLALLGSLPKGAQKLAEALPIQEDNGMTTLGTIAFYLPECLKEILAFAKRASNGAEKIAEALPLQTEDGWTTLTVIMRYGKKYVQEILDFAKKAPNGAEKVAEAMPCQIPFGRTTLAIAVCYAPEHLEALLALLSHVSNGAEKIAEALPLQAQDGWTTLALIVCYAPEHLPAMLDCLKKVPNGPETLAKVLPFQESNSRQTTLAMIVECAPENLEALLALLDNAPNGAEKLAEALPLQDDNGQTTLSIIASLAPNYLKKILNCLKKVPNGAEKVAEALPRKENSGRTTLTVIACCVPECLKEILDLMKALSSSNGAEKLVEALPLETENSWTTIALAFIVRYIPQSLQGILDCLKKTPNGSEALANVLASQAHDQTLLATIAQYAPESLERVLALLHNIPNGAEKLVEALSFKADDGTTALDVIAQHASACLQKVLHCVEKGYNVDDRSQKIKMIQNKISKLKKLPKSTHNIKQVLNHCRSKNQTEVDGQQIDKNQINYLVKNPSIHYHNNNSNNNETNKMESDLPIVVQFSREATRLFALQNPHPRLT